jgi:hypothetical protein
VVKALDLVASSLGLRFESSWVQIISCGYAYGEAESYLIHVGGTLCRFLVYPSRIGTRNDPSLGGSHYKKKKKKKKKNYKKKMIKIVFKLCETLMTVTYHHTMQPTFTATHSIDTDTMVALPLICGSSTYLSVFNY